MWVFLLIVSLLIRAIVGVSETGSILSDVTQLKNGSNDIVYHRSEKLAVDAPNEWKEGSFKPERKKTQTAPDNIVSDETKNNFGDAENSKSIEYDRGTDSNVKVVVKKREVTGSNFDWFLQNKKSLLKKEAYFIYCHGTPQPNYYSNGGKRGNPFSRSNVPTTGKRNKFTDDQDDRDTFVDGYDVKRIVEIGKVKYTPFNNWGGKRARETIDEEHDREQFVVIIKSMSNNTPSNVHWECKKYLPKLNAWKKSLMEIMQHDEGATTDTEKGTSFNQNPPYVNDETKKKDYTTQEAYEDMDWVMSMPEKRKAESYYPWGGKRNQNTQDFRFGDDYFNELAPSAKGRKIFFPWGG